MKRRLPVQPPTRTFPENPIYREKVVGQIGQHTFEVHGADDRYVFLIVRLDARECSCRLFRQLQMPCMHAAAAIAHVSLDTVLFIDRMYKISTLRSLYEAEIETVPTHGLEDAARSAAQGRTPAKDYGLMRWLIAWLISGLSCRKARWLRGRLH